MPFTQRVKTRPVLRIELGSLTTWIRGPQEVQSAWSHYCHSSSAIQVMKWFQVPDPATECLGKGNGEQRDTRTRFSHMGLRWSVVRESLGSAHQHSLGGMTQSVMICAKEGYDLRIMQSVIDLKELSRKELHPFPSGLTQALPMRNPGPYMR
ncbi:predicted protein [Histoplasma capsulatum H143]|uniref:Uncharacterized protein n=1 Tax=Ajellomyces capsulatus (strain H143) TaxID=544712 RepID=C6H9V2_AJECH|nr:predicted protein [Histoplasma capsulatum H143]